MYITKNKPTEPPETLNEFAVSRYSCEELLAKGQWPCLECCGKGWVYDPNDPPCSIDGNKGRHRLKCHICYGQGVGPYEPLQKLFWRTWVEYRQELAEWKRLRRVWKQLQFLLTEDRRRALEVFGIR